MIMAPRYALVSLLLGACGGAAPRATEPGGTAMAVAPAPCLPLPSDAVIRDRGFALGADGREVRLYRLGPGGCGTLVASFDPEGPFAFGSIREPKRDGMPELGIETWLMHGDRRRQTFSWSGGRYVSTGPAEEIPGPRR
jgi:hypothetical protein